MFVIFPVDVTSSFCLNRQ